MRTTFLFLLICMLPASVSAQRSDELDRTAVSSVKISRQKDGKAVVTTINRRFTLVNAPVRLLRGALLLVEEVRHDREIVNESGKGLVKVEAWGEPNFSKRIWSIEQSGDEGRVSDEFYVVTKYGCCMAHTTSVYFNIENGERVFSATDKPSSVIVPNTDQYRYVAYHAREAAIVPTETDDTDLKGVLQYASPTAPLWKLAIYSKRDIVASIKFRYEGKVEESGTLMLWGVDGKRDKSSFSDFAIVVAAGSAGEIVLPVVNDTIDLTRATIPPHFRVELIK